MDFQTADVPPHPPLPLRSMKLCRTCRSCSTNRLQSTPVTRLLDSRAVNALVVRKDISLEEANSVFQIHSGLGN